jgi:hypothetical protein
MVRAAGTDQPHAEAEGLTIFPPRPGRRTSNSHSEAAPNGEQVRPIGINVGGVG